MSAKIISRQGNSALMHSITLILAVLLLLKQTASLSTEYQQQDLTLTNNNVAVSTSSLDGNVMHFVVDDEEDEDSVMRDTTHSRSLQQTSGKAMRINVGNRRTNYTDTSGNVWTRDTKFLVKGAITNVKNVCSSIRKTYNVSLANKDCTYRYGTFQYRIPISSILQGRKNIGDVNTAYRVQLHFTELFQSSKGKRVFDMTVNDNTYINNYDIFKNVGQYIPTKRTLLYVEIENTNANPGVITIESTSVIGTPVLMGIVINQVTVRTLPVPVPVPASVPTRATKPVPTPSPFVPIRVNCGGTKPFIDPLTGYTWVIDSPTFVDTGYPYDDGIRAPIAGTTADELFYTDRVSYGLPGSKMVYSFKVPPGRYIVKLLFGETFFTSPGKRQFNVTLQGSRIRSNLDLFVAAGGSNRAYVVTTLVSVRFTNAIRIAFTNVIENAIVAGIEIIQSAAAAPIAIPKATPINLPKVYPTKPPIVRPPINFRPVQPIESFPLRINCGATKSYTDPSGNVWLSDRYYIEGYNYTELPPCPSISKTTLDQLFCDERFFDKAYDGEYKIPTGNGQYQVILWFSETLFRKAGERVFTVKINGVIVQTNLDITAIGFDEAVSLSAVVTTTNDISITFSNIVEFAKVNAIEVLKLK